MSYFAPDILKDRVAFVTGGATGICKEVARAFAAHGAKVAIASRKLENLEAARKELEAGGAECEIAVCDVRNPEQVEEGIAKTLERFGRLDIVLNGAAGNFPVPMSQLSYKGFRTVVEIDLEGTYNVSKAAFEGYLKDHGGAILNVSATLQYTGTPFQAHVSAAKAGIDSLTRTCAVEWGPLGIRTNAIAPGPIAGTEGMDRLAPGDLRAKMEAGIPLKRFGEKQEIADAAVFLASDASSYTNGAILVVDGAAWLASSRMLGGMEL